MKHALVAALLGTALLAPLVPATTATAMPGQADCKAVRQYDKARVSKQRLHDGHREFKVTVPRYWVCAGDVSGVATPFVTGWKRFR